MQEERYGTILHDSRGKLGRRIGTVRNKKEDYGTVPDRVLRQIKKKGTVQIKRWQIKKIRDVTSRGRSTLVTVKTRRNKY